MRILGAWDLLGHTGAIYSLVCDPDRKLLYSAGADGIIAQWSCFTAKAAHALARTPHPIYTMHYMSLTQALFVGQTTGLVYVLKPQEKKLQRAFQAHHNAVMGLGSHPTDLEGWSTGRDGLFLYWDLERAEPFGHLLVSEAGLRGFVPLPKQRLFACLGRDGSLHIVDRDTRSVQRKMVIEERPLFSIAMSLDEKQLWVGTHAGRIYSWDTGTWTLHQVIEAHTRATNALRVDPTGRYLASAGRDRLVHIWGTATGRKCLTLSGHLRSVNALAWIDESTLASGGDDGLVKIWHLEV